MKPSSLQGETGDHTWVSEPNVRARIQLSPLPGDRQPAAGGNPGFWAPAGYLGGRLSAGRIWQKAQHLHTRAPRACLRAAWSTWRERLLAEKERIWALAERGG